MGLIRHCRAHHIPCFLFVVILELQAESISLYFHILYEKHEPSSLGYCRIICIYSAWLRVCLCSFCNKFGYHVEQANHILAKFFHYLIALWSLGIRKLFLLLKTFNLELIFLIDLNLTDSSDTALSNTYVKYVTFDFCFILFLLCYIKFT